MIRINYIFCFYHNINHVNFKKNVILHNFFKVINSISIDLRKFEILIIWNFRNHTYRFIKTEKNTFDYIWIVISIEKKVYFFKRDNSNTNKFIYPFRTVVVYNKNLEKNLYHQNLQYRYVNFENNSYQKSSNRKNLFTICDKINQ